MPLIDRGHVIVGPHRGRFFVVSQNLQTAAGFLPVLRMNFE